tara:strand:+ start:735 stop:1178 length:444 start_codon:yes stop_codon:yes gene_type:complete
VCGRRRQRPELPLQTNGDQNIGPLDDGDTWGAGPSAMALKLVGPWTFGALVNHVTDITGDNDHLNTSFIQPFLVYTTASATSFALNMETTYDWDAKETAMPVNMEVNQVSKIGSQLSYSAISSRNIRAMRSPHSVPSISAFPTSGKT